LRFICGLGLLKGDVGSPAKCNDYKYYGHSSVEFFVIHTVHFLTFDILTNILH
jgi:hypothetical protein